MALSPNSNSTMELSRCLHDLGASDASIFRECDDLIAEFSVVKKLYLVKILKEHPDKGGDPATFRATRAAWEVVRELHDQGKLPQLKGGSFLTYRVSDDDADDSGSDSDYVDDDVDKRSKKKAKRSQNGPSQAAYCHQYAIDENYAIRRVNDGIREEGLQTAQQFQTMANEPTFDWVRYVEDADGEFWVSVKEGQFVAKQFVKSGRRTNCSEQQSFRDFTNGSNKKIKAFSEMKNVIGKCGFAQATANKNLYSDDQVYLFYHPDFKPGADVSRIVKRNMKTPQRKIFVPPTRPMLK